MRRMIIVALLCALSYAQTDVKTVERRNLQSAEMCPCIGLANGTTTDFPDYGNECLAHDRTLLDGQPMSPYFNDFCSDNSANLCLEANWCLLEWCYIDNDDPDCDYEDVFESSLYPGNYYSYAKCNFPDCYTYTVDDRVSQPDGCPVTGDGVNCDCPIACILDWIGDGVCDQRTEGVNCAGCDPFWNGTSAGEGVFDDGDCDLITTTQDPSINADIVGHNTCSVMQGVCTSTSFSASASPLVNPSDDGNNYGCLTEAELGNVGWFAFRVTEDGDFVTWMRSADSSMEFQFVIWGPYDTSAEAVGDCGTLGEPASCSTTGAIDIQQVQISDVNAGDVFIMMISDKNENDQAIIKIENSNLACDVVEDAFQCQSSPTVSIDFTHATVTRHNLANYYASTAGLDMPKGIYYSNVGQYGADTLGLLVTTTNDNYRCHHNHKDGNMCTHVLSPQPNATTSTNAAFGQVNLFAGDTPLKLQFRIEDDGSEEGSELALGETFERIKLTVFDIDAGQPATPGGESVEIVKPVSVCPGGVVTSDSTAPYFPNLVEQKNRLDFSENDFATENGFAWDFATGCWNSRAEPPVSNFIVKQKVACQEDPTHNADGSVANASGSCKDNNPDNVDTLNELQSSMAVEAEFHDVTRDGIEIIAKVSRQISTDRNFWFAGSSTSIGRTCCRDKFNDQNCPGGFINGNRECGTMVGGCIIDNCCLPIITSTIITSTSHGDPIINTFYGECYDLHQDGNWLASSHPDFDHDVHVAVYNEYMRQVTVTNKNGDILLAINNYGEVVNNDYPYYFNKETKKCPEDYEKDDCIGEYISISFDAQDMYYDVHAQLRHDYNDQGLREGEVGFHMDVYPQPYNKRFLKRKDDYTGLYFHNPMPGTLETCTERYQRTGQL